jgi:hypothetical protein
VQGHVAGDGFHLRRHEIGGERDNVHDPDVLWAVTAVIALVPYTPRAANVFDPPECPRLRSSRCPQWLTPLADCSRQDACGRRMAEHEQC